MKETFLCQLILLFATSLTVMSNRYDECGLLNTKTGLHAISDSRPDDMYAPWLASVGRYNDTTNVYKVSCSGIVLTSRILITAAHCFQLPPWQIPNHIRVGGNRRDNKYVVERRIQEFKVHPGYTFPVYYFDVAVIILDEDLSFSRQITAICLPQNVSSYPGAKNSFITVQGWGKDDEGKSGQSASEVSLGIRSVSECNHRFNDSGPYKNTVNQAMPKLIKDNILFCAESDLNSNLGTCHADSGGPAIQK